MGFDFGAILKSLLPPLIVWTTAVIFITFVGHQPGVICVTPVAWLMACWVGMKCVWASRSAAKSSLLIEAAIAGALLGLLQGVLFAVIAPRMGDIRPDEQQKYFVLTIVMIVAGALVSAGLSVIVGAAQANRRAAKRS
ncbi:MAG TPA: hypothetical protein VLJ61_04955 [Pyrinomonadaceae bacterium]|nr:hypothetical protein [Pyrinomonadaceae bacterium]